MNVIVDGLHARVGGGLSYATAQLAALGRVRPDIRPTVLVTPENAGAFGLPGVTPVPLTARSLPQRVAQTHRAVLRLRRSADLLYCPGNMIPLLPDGLPTVMAMQNSNYFGAARSRSANITHRRRLRRWVSIQSMKRADRVIVISESLRESMIHDGDWNDRCVVLQSGASDLPPVGQPVAACDDGEPFLLSLANDYAHKHLEQLVDGWVVATRRAGGSAPLPRLVFAGDIDPARQAALRISAAGLGEGPAFRFLGPVGSRAEVRWLLERATAMVSTSDLEAFALTPAEAGATGCPAILTDIPPHREIASTHAHYFAPGDVEALAALLLQAAAGGMPRETWHWPLSWDDHARQLGHHFDEVLADQRARPDRRYR